MGGRRALLLGAVSTAFLAACGKTRREPPPLTWFAARDLDRAYALAARDQKPLVIQFGASWDMASKELEHVTFPDPEVAGRLAVGFVLARIDCSDDEDPLTMRLATRYDVKGTPTLVVLDARSDRELWRANEFVPPKRLAPVLDELRAHHAALVARGPTPLLRWNHDPDDAMREAVACGRPALLFFGPAYDHASVSTRRECFGDSAVAQLLHDELVLCDVWCDRGANEMWDRFAVRGSPTSIVIAPARNRQLARIESFAGPPAYARFLRDALARYRT